MRGYILLEGGAEFGGAMERADRQAVALAGGQEARISIIPAAAAPDKNYARAGKNGVGWFNDLGFNDVTSLLLIDHETANQTAVANALRDSNLIYLLGGFTHYLAETLKGSEAWEAVREAYEEGAVVAGSSAGAMVLCEYYFDPGGDRVVEGLGLVPNACVLPHHNTFGQKWAAVLKERLPEIVLLGIDERTGMLNDGPQGAWHVYGGGNVTLYRGGETAVYQPGQSFQLA